MDKLESDFLKSQELTLLLWYRCIGDAFFIWTHAEEKSALFLNDLNNYHPKFTHESNKKHRHQCLHYTSSHPEHTKKSAVSRQALRLGRICLEEKGFEKHICEMKEGLRQIILCAFGLQLIYHSDVIYCALVYLLLT